MHYAIILPIITTLIVICPMLAYGLYSTLFSLLTFIHSPISYVGRFDENNILVHGKDPSKVPTNFFSGKVMVGVFLQKGGYYYFTCSHFATMMLSHQMIMKFWGTLERMFEKRKFVVVSLSIRSLSRKTGRVIEIPTKPSLIKYQEEYNEKIAGSTSPNGLMYLFSIIRLLAFMAFLVGGTADIIHAI